MDIKVNSTMQVVVAMRPRISVVLEIPVPVGTSVRECECQWWLRELVVAVQVLVAPRAGPVLVVLQRLWVHLQHVSESIGEGVVLVQLVYQSSPVTCVCSCGMRLSNTISFNLLDLLPTAPVTVEKRYKQFEFDLLFLAKELVSDDDACCESLRDRQHVVVVRLEMGGTPTRVVPAPTGFYVHAKHARRGALGREDK